MTDKSLLQRISLLETVQSRLQSEHIVFLPWAKSSAEKHSLYEAILDSGKEGVMLKRLDAVNYGNTRIISSVSSFFRYGLMILSVNP